MCTPIVTLIQLNELTLELVETQTWIDHARSVARTNQVVQLELDRQQSELDARLNEIELTKLYIAMTN